MLLSHPQVQDQYYDLMDFFQSNGIDIHDWLHDPFAVEGLMDSSHQVCACVCGCVRGCVCMCVCVCTCVCAWVHGCVCGYMLSWVRVHVC